MKLLLSFGLVCGIALGFVATLTGCPIVDKPAATSTPATQQQAQPQPKPANSPESQPSK